MTKVRIVGGGLAGVLAALEAHRLGARRIEIHERLGELGGALAPKVSHGVELRDRWMVFGGREDPARRLLEWHGARFDDVALACGSVNPCPRGEAQAAKGFAGPVMIARDPSFGRLTGDTLADRLRVYPDDVRAQLARYCRWRLGVWLDEAHASAAVPRPTAWAAGRLPATYPGRTPPGRMRPRAAVHQCWVQAPRDACECGSWLQRSSECGRRRRARGRDGVAQEASQHCRSGVTHQELA